MDSNDTPAAWTRPASLQDLMDLDALPEDTRAMVERVYRHRLEEEGLEVQAEAAQTSADLDLVAVGRAAMLEEVTAGATEHVGHLEQLAKDLQAAAATLRESLAELAA